MPEMTEEANAVKVIAASSRSVAPYRLLDTWRGVASLWVVLYHASMVFVTRYPALNANPVYAFGQYGHLGVRIFFVISGYCITHAACANLRRNQGVSAFMRARLRRIYPPVWFAQALYAVLSLLAALLVTRGILKSSVLMQNGVLHQPPLYFIANISLLGLPLRQVFIVGPTWTLCYEITFYAMVAIALVVAYRQKRAAERVLFTILHSFTLLGLGLIIFAPWSVLCAYPLDFWPQFGLGVVAYDILHNPRRRSAQAAAILIGVFVVAVIGSRDVTLTMLSSSTQTYLFSLGFTLLILAMYRYDSPLAKLKIVKFGAAIGLFSYSLYLTHTVVLGLETQVLSKLRLSEHWHWFTFPLLVGVSLGFGRLFFQFCEKPFLNSRR